MEEIDFASNGIVEVKNAAGEVQELRFKIRLLSLLGKVVKNIFLSFLIFIAIIFSSFHLVLCAFFFIHNTVSGKQKNNCCNQRQFYYKKFYSNISI